MATIKSFTSLEQSKKLAEILPIESADMHYWLAWRGDVPKEKRNTPKVGTPNKDAIKTYWCPCWSLSALLGVLPRVDIENEICSDDTYDYRVKAYIGDGYIGDWYDNPVDACVTMIEKLNELNLL